jgi:hypothetical protein
MNRTTALDIIRAEFAEHGRPTQASTRVYVENWIGFAAYMGAVRAGTKIFNEAHNND